MGGKSKKKNKGGVLSGFPCCCCKGGSTNARKDSSWYQKPGTTREHYTCCYCWDLTEWSQLRLWAWKPILDETYVIVILFALTALFIPIALYIRHENNRVVMVRGTYHDEAGCRLSKDNLEGRCTITLNITDDMKAPIYFYYELRNFFQAHKSYAKSRLSPGKSGTQPDLSVLEGMSDCAEGLHSGDPENNFAPDTTKALNPCGLIAKSFFNDQFNPTVVRKGTRIQLCPTCNKDSGATERWREDDNWDDREIALPIDRIQITGDTTLKSAESNVTTKRGNSDGIKLPRLDDQEMLVWMRQAMSQNFLKLHRVISKTNFQKGDLVELEVVSRFPVYQFNGQKGVVFSTMSGLGGQNMFLWIEFLVTGMLSGLSGIVFLYIFYSHVQNS